MDHQLNWNTFTPIDAEIDKAISSLLQGAGNDITSSSALPSWCQAGTPFSSESLNCLLTTESALGNQGFHDVHVDGQKVPILWSMGSNNGVTSHITTQTLASGADMATPAHAESLKGDMGGPLGHLPTLSSSTGSTAPASLEEFMDLNELGVDTATPHLSPTSVSSLSPLDTDFKHQFHRVQHQRQDPLSQYHNTIAAGHAKHLTDLVDPAGHFNIAGHPSAHALASSLSCAVHTSSAGRRTRGYSSAGLTIQQRRRLSLMTQRGAADATTTARKRQLSAPGSCLPGITTSPEVAKVNLQDNASPMMAASYIFQQEATIPGTQDVQDSWNDVVLANSHDLVFVLSLKGTVLYISPSVERILGFVQEEVVGRALIEFCHPADVGPFSRELKESTVVPADEEGKGAGSRDGNALKGVPKINLVMRMSLKAGGYTLIDATGSLSVDPPKHRKVVVCSGRPHPIPMLPWKHVREDLRDLDPSAWLKLSHTGIFLGCTGPINKILGIEDVNLVGRHIRDLPMVASSSELLEALRSGRTISVQDWIEGSSKQRLPVKLTVYPWTSDGRSSNIAFVHVQQRQAEEEATGQTPLKRKASALTESSSLSSSSRLDTGAGVLTGSVATADGGTARVMSRGDAASTVFSELTGYHNGSWLVEMQKLQNANKRLRHELQALTKWGAVRLPHRGIGIHT